MKLVAEWLGSRCNTASTKECPILSNVPKLQLTATHARSYRLYAA